MTVSVVSGSVPDLAQLVPVLSPRGTFTENPQYVFTHVLNHMVWLITVSHRVMIIMSTGVKQIEHILYIDENSLYRKLKKSRAVGEQIFS